MSRNPSTWEPGTQAKMLQVMAASEAIGRPLFLVWAERTFEEQAEQYAKGRTTPGPDVTAERPLGRTVTNAKPGGSWHNYRRAGDFAFADENGQPTWDRPQTWWDLLGLMGEAVGLEWGGRDHVAARGDYGHLQNRDGMTIAQMLQEVPDDTRTA